MKSEDGKHFGKIYKYITDIKVPKGYEAGDFYEDIVTKTQYVKALRDGEEVYLEILFKKGEGMPG